MTNVDYAIEPRNLKKHECELLVNLFLSKNENKKPMVFDTKSLAPKDINLLITLFISSMKPTNSYCAS